MDTVVENLPSALGLSHGLEFLVMGWVADEEIGLLSHVNFVLKNWENYKFKKILLFVWVILSIFG